MSTSPIISSLLDPVEQAMSEFENVNPEYNNPGGIEYGPLAESYGATSASSGLAIFPSQEAGEAAFNDAYQNYVDQNYSINGLINAWAPPSAGNPNNENYVDYVASESGLNPNESILDQLGIEPTPSGMGLQPKSGYGGSSLTQLLFSQSVVGRGVAIVLGLILIGGGIFMFRPVQENVVQPIKETVKSTVRTAAEGAAAA